MDGLFLIFVYFKYGFFFCFLIMYLVCKLVCSDVYIYVVCNENIKDDNSNFLKLFGGLCYGG